MLLANYLLAQRLVTHARKRALLRHQPPPPLEGGMQEVVDVLRGGVRLHFDITSQTRKPCKNPWQGSQGVRRRASSPVHHRVAGESHEAGAVRGRRTRQIGRRSLVHSLYQSDSLLPRRCRAQVAPGHVGRCG
jgi:hypothetical protein